MNVRNCRKCGRIFNYVSGPVTCPRCREDLEKKFQEVKKYVRENAGAGIQEVAEECDVDPKQIRKWIQEERLEFSEDSPVKIPCEGCGAMIRSGRFCEKCKAQVTKDIQGVVGQSKPRQTESDQIGRRNNERMHFLKGTEQL